MLTAIRYHRFLRGWKATDVARHLRISASYYSRIESGKMEVPALLRRSIARLFKLPQKALFVIPPTKRNGRIHAKARPIHSARL